ncbi:flagellar hook-associated protein FlgK [Rhodomicrobium lacus]|uniref:flagellar hook-associated protein FlgK n=1 Tax=Rhodomicrobium lacus TaxID=2498452 RepID=UPI0026E33A0E|nr:flagellar hook-associated protein FlgK [Rhodomicrobium lacus]WKW50646.1 flagellar hook-associated protein FlgK [Rhodomicrobium lacus]
MSLTSALNTASAGVSVASSQTAVVARNVANQQTDGASRKLANVVTINGLPSVVSITRVTNAAALKSLLTANADDARDGAVSDALTQLQSTVGATTVDDTTSPTALIAALSDALSTYAASPESQASVTAVQAASDLANALNSAADTVQQVRADADAAIGDSVSTINNLLTRFQAVNETIVKGTVAGADITDALDERDSILQSLSAEIGISTVTRSNNDMAIYTDSGVTLFDKTARSVTFEAKTTFTASTQGNAVYVDGVPVTTSGASYEIKSGRLAGLVEVRDDLAVTYQDQLDEIARGLITAFQETDQSGGGGSPQAGLFTDAGSLVVPTSGTVSEGLSSRISVAASVVATPTLLRDGGISTNGADPYVYNPTPGETGYTDRLNELVSGLKTAQAFDPVAGAGTSLSLADYAAASASWLGVKSQAASSTAAYSATVKSTAATALSNATGVNIDTELSKMLALEQSYGASAKLVSAVDQMFSDLLNAI